MSNEIYGAAGLALLQAVGFTETDPFTLEMAVSHAVGEPVGEETIKILVHGAVGNTPGVYHAVATSSRPVIKAIKFDATDARDIMAFAIAVRTEQVALTGRHDAIPQEDTFTSGDGSETCIHNPFADDTYGDWAVDRAPTATAIHLVNPVETYGEAYLAWRDDRAAGLLREAVPGPVGPGL